MKWVLTIGVPVLAAVLWAMFVRPGSTAPLPVRIVVEVAVFGGAAVALWVLGYRSLAAIFLVVAVIIRILDLTSHSEEARPACRLTNLRP